MTPIRQPAVAGRFYPEGALALSRDVERLLVQARTAAVRPPGRLKALLVPHAGYAYSGRTAACGYTLVGAARTRLRRVVLLGPAHYAGFSGLAVPDAEAFATPLGVVPLDTGVLDRLCALPPVIRSDHAHEPEHALEVQLPFLQLALDAFTLVPVLVGNAGAEDVAAVLEECWDGPETLVLVSSDLSHYLPYAQASAEDADTVRRILALEQPLPDRRACGARAVSGLLLAAAAHRLRPSLLDRRTSGDTAGDRDRVVGYAAISFSEPETEV